MTGRKARVFAGALAAGAGITVTVASAAWACTAWTEITAPKIAPAKGLVKVEGVGLPKAVEIRWNDVGGPVLASGPTDSAGDAHFTVAMPDVGPGTYFLVATDGGRGVARTVVEIPSAAAAGSDASPVPAVPAGDATGGLVYRAVNRGTQANSQSGAGMALFAVGAVAIVGAFAVATVATTRRTPVSRRSSRRATQPGRDAGDGDA